MGRIELAPVVFEANVFEGIYLTLADNAVHILKRDIHSGELSLEWGVVVSTATGKAVNRFDDK
ncbi:hypothetical protein I8H84_02560 [Candidatus Saccharibacteria bacterium]|nr:hypothetical protein [Candidatus Saccharibacteria bacterium]MBH1972826.1 hypothetical protein [Candidatus Saccharibacteria bacterium]MBH1991027.1 hypothetical protein [Candidatus Saccharibacteria bacterium]